MVIFLASLATAVTAGVHRGRRVGQGASRWTPESSVGPMARAGRPRRDTTQFWLASIAAGAGTYLVVLAVTSLPIVALMPALVVATLPRAYFGRQRALRLAQVQEAWPDGLRDLLRPFGPAPRSLTRIESLAAFGPAPLRHAFQGFAVYSRSLGVAPALEMIRADLADPTSDRVIEVLILAYERGGSVVPEILSDLAEATTRDIWTMEQIRSEALEQKINARVVFVLPWFVLVAITAKQGPFRDFYSSRAGVMVAVIGGLMSLLGIAIARTARQPAGRAEGFRRWERHFDGLYPHLCLQPGFLRSWSPCWWGACDGPAPSLPGVPDSPLSGTRARGTRPACPTFEAAPW